MSNSVETHSHDLRVAALAELRDELSEFNWDGLVQLREDLERGSVIRGSWAGCVISYKRGAPGSCRRDRMGRARNNFTVLWDNGWLVDAEVSRLVESELARRRATTLQPAAVVDPAALAG